MNLMKELKYFTCLIKISKWLYFAKKMVMLVTLALAVCSAIGCCCSCKDSMSCCKK